jgi:hypothetical protein
VTDGGISDERSPPQRPFRHVLHHHPSTKIKDLDAIKFDPEDQLANDAKENKTLTVRPIDL